VHSQIKQREPSERLVPQGGIDLHVSDMTATFSGDVTLAMAQESLKASGQWLAVDGEESASLAELIECNSTGPLRLGFGGWRDNLLGVQFINGTGQLITAGGRVLKNVAGYDLSRFMVGQFGCFGRIETITTRTYLRPAGAVLAAFEPRRDQLNAMLVTSCRPQWCVLTPEALLMGYLGDEVSIAYYQDALKRYSPEEVLTHSLEDDIAARSKLWSMPNGVESFRAMVPPSKIGQFVEQAKVAGWVADAAFGIVKASGTFDPAVIRKSADTAGGAVMFFDIDGKPFDLRPDPDVKVLLEKLKYAFDPDGKLVPIPI